MPSLKDSSGNAILTNVFTLRRGRLCSVPHVKPGLSSSAQKHKRTYFAYMRSLLFNALPVHLRNMYDCEFHKFKNSVDSFLSPSSPQTQ